jgi:uncharacterized membrane protein YjfL (UPF0719 family)
MNLAAIDFGTVSPDKLAHGVVASVLYFLVGVAVLLAGFVMVDVLTPGSLRREVFVQRRPNAVVIAAANYVAIAAVVISAIFTSSDSLGQGLLDVAVYGAVGVALQGVALVALALAIPGRFRDHIEDPNLHPAVFATAAIMLAVGGINAAALS